MLLSELPLILAAPQRDVEFVKGRGQDGRPGVVGPLLPLFR